MTKKEKISKAKPPDTSKKRKKAEDELHESEELFRNYMELAPDGVYMSDLKGTFLYGNSKSEEIIGYRREELIGKNFLELNLLTEEGMNKAVQWLQENMKGNPTGPDEIELIRKDGQIIPVEINTSVVQRMGQNIILAFVRDITDRKQSEKSLRQSEEKYRTILEDIQEGYFEVDLAGNLTFFNNSLCQFFGYSREELMGMNYLQYTDKEHSKKLFQAFNRVYSTGKSTEGFDWQIIRKDGTKRYVEASVSLREDSSGKLIGFRGIARDVTEHKRADEALLESEEKYRGIIENMQEGYFETDLPGNFIFVNEAVCELMGYSREELIGKNNRQFANEGSSKKIYQAFNKIYRTGKAAKGIEHEYIRKDGIKGFTALSISLVRDEEGKPIGFRCISHDITERKRAEEQLHQTLENLKKAVGTTIQVLVSAVEARDPYTAGHQKRVADMARAIATEMGLAQEIIEGIRVAGSIHDIGKISIPAEILSKPTKLTNTEFSIIKEHSQIGHDMLKDVESPWPLAEIVHQHHERMNGSGYPRNMKGDEILLEARILAVADVVEAMGSHRPYRPTLGTEAALEEITKKKGILYGNAVADACLRLFKEKGYQLK